MRRIALPLTLAGTFAVAALGAHAVSGGGTGSARIVDVRNSADDAQETPSPSETPDAPDDSDGRTSSPTETPSADGTPSASETPDAPDDSDGRVSDDGDDDDDSDGRGGDDDEDRSGSNSGKG